MSEQQPVKNLQMVHLFIFLFIWILMDLLRNAISFIIDSFITRFMYQFIVSSIVLIIVCWGLVWALKKKKWSGHVNLPPSFPQWLKRFLDKEISLRSFIWLGACIIAVYYAIGMRVIEHISNYWK